MIVQLPVDGTSSAILLETNHCIYHISTKQTAIPPQKDAMYLHQYNH